MAEHDLWNEDDFFEKLKKEKRAAEKPQSPEPEGEQGKAPEMPSSPLDEEPESLESDLFEQEKPAEEEPAPEDDIFFGADEEKQSSEPPEIAQDFEEEPVAEESVPFEAEEESQEEFLEPIESEPEEKPEESSAKQPPKKYALSDNYDDEKLAPVNYKPVVIGAIVIVLLIILFFVLRGKIFKGSAEKEVQPAQTPKTEQPKTGEQGAAQNPLLAKQTEFFKKLAGANAFSLGLVQNIQNALSTKSTHLTSLLLYNDEITFEIHCKNRDVLAKTTMNLRNNMSGIEGLKLVSTDEWPDRSINAVFYAKLKSTSVSATPGPKIADAGALQQWIKMLGQQFSVKINSVQKMGTSPANLELKRTRVLILGQGKYQAVLSFINALAAANRNLKVHKLVLAALSKKNFSKSNYRIELTLDLFK